MILLDTNVLIRITNADDPLCAIARSAIPSRLANRERLVIVPQNLYEFWAVATRAPHGGSGGQNGLGMSPEQASQWIGFLQRRFTLLPDRPDLSGHWLALVRKHAIKGFHCHDARLVAALGTYGASHLMTFNGADFRGLPVTVIDPCAD